MAQASMLRGNSLQHSDARRTTHASRAIVVFEDRQERSIIRLLRPGFRHCFCLVGGDLSWTVCDPLLTRIELVPLLGLEEGELAAHYTCTGRTVLLGRVSDNRMRQIKWLRPMSCVEVLKRVLNLDARHVFTPYQLYRSLLNSEIPGERFYQHAIGP